MALFLLLAAGCAAPCDAEPTYAGKASDEAFLSFVDAASKVTVNESRGSTFVVPMAGDVLSNGAAPVFKWTTPLISSRPRFEQHAPGKPRSILRDLLGGAAWAHLPPVTGPLYRITVDVPAARCPTELLTSLSEWVLPEALWTTLRATAGQPVSVDIVSAYLTENRITEGPFRPSSKVTFSVAK